MSQPLRLVRSEERTSTGAAPQTRPPPEWEQEREELLELLAQQQRVAQAGLMTAGLSHDVKNHLQNMIGTALLALQRDDPMAWKTALEEVQQQCLALGEITDAFLGFVKRRDDACRDGFLLSTVVQQVGALMKSFAKKHRVAVTCEVSGVGEVEGDLRMAVQAAVNLASNAVRACAENGGQVWVVASCPIDGFCRLEVRDTGPGIPDEVRTRFFRPFATGHAATGGNGLGVFIVRQAVRKLRGSIRVQTCQTGTTIRLDFPVRRRPQ